MQSNEQQTISDMQIEICVVIFSLRNAQLQVLLRANTDQIYTESWKLPGAFLSFHQSIEELAGMTVKKLTGIKESYLEQLYTYGEENGCPTAHVVTITYFALIPSDQISIPSENLHLAQWFPADNFPSVIMNHQEIIQYALRRLRYKLEYSAVGFELLPENFSLSEIQQTYEIILGEKLDKRNFRRRILDAGVIEPTPHQRIGEGRPARLYRYRADAVAEIKTRRLFP